MKKRQLLQINALDRDETSKWHLSVCQNECGDIQHLVAKPDHQEVCLKLCDQLSNNFLSDTKCHEQ